MCKYVLSEHNNQHLQRIYINQEATCHHYYVRYHPTLLNNDGLVDGVLIYGLGVDSCWLGCTHAHPYNQYYELPLNSVQCNKSRVLLVPFHTIMVSTLPS